MKLSQILFPMVASFGVDFRGIEICNGLPISTGILGYQNHLAKYRPQREFSKSVGNDIPLVLRQGRTVTIFNNGITQNEKYQGFELGLEMAAQELFEEILNLSYVTTHFPCCLRSHNLCDQAINLHKFQAFE